MKKQCKTVVYILCCIAIFYLNAAESQGWWNWVTSLASRARAYVVQEYLPSGVSLSASIMGSGIPGALIPAAWVYGRSKQQVTSESLAAVPVTGQPQVVSGQSSGLSIPRSASAPHLAQLAAVTRVVQQSAALPDTTKQTINKQIVAVQKSMPKKKEVSEISYHWAAAEFQGRRKGEMEDASIFEFKHPYLIAAIYDGHGGNRVSHMLAEGYTDWGLKSLHDIIFDQIRQQSAVDIPTILRKSFLKFDQTMHSKNHRLSSGSTAVIALIDIQKQYIYFAWVGDSRGLVINQNGAVVAHTTDHKPTDSKERARITRAGAYVDERENRVYNYLNDSTKVVDRTTGLNMSRAFGDFKYAKYRKDNAYDVISAEPDVISFNFKGEPYKVLLACDGIFEKGMSDQDVADIIMRGDTIDLKLPKEKSKQYSSLAGDSKLMKIIVKNIVVSAYAKGSSDNMTALIIDINNK